MSEEQLLHQARQATRGTPQEALQATTEAVHLPQAVQATAEEVPAEDSAEAVRAEAEDHPEAEDKDNSKRRAQ